MLSYVILIIFQTIAALGFAPVIVSYIPLQGDLTLFIFALVFALLIWLVGQIGGEVLKGLSRPSGAVLTTAMVGGLIGAAIIFFFPQIASYIPFQVQALYFPLIGAIAGYFVQK